MHPPPRSPLYHTVLCCCLVAKLCPTLCDCMDCSPPGSSVHGILQARILEWVAISFFRGSSCVWGSNLCLLHWKVNSLLVSHLGSVYHTYILVNYIMDLSICLSLRLLTHFFFFKVNCRHQYTCSSVLQPAFKLGLVFVDVNFVFNACLKHSFVKF